MLDAIDNGGSGKTGQGHPINCGRQIAEELDQTVESPDLPKQQPEEADSSVRITLTAQAQLKRIGREMKLPVDRREIFARTAGNKMSGRL